MIFAAAMTTSAQPVDLNRGLLAWLPFTQNLKDASPNHLPVQTRGTVKIENGAAHFPGGSDWLELPTLPFHQPFALSLWIKADGPDAVYGLVEQHEANARNRLFHVMLRNRSQPYLGFYLNDVISPRSINRGEWTHLIFQYTGTHQEIWVNSKLLCSRKAQAYAGSQGLTRIGKNPGWTNVPPNNFQGSMRELRIYGRALLPQEVAELARPPAGLELARGTEGTQNTTTVAAEISPLGVVAPTLPFLSIEGNKLVINGTQGEIYSLLVTTNLSNWAPLATLTNSTGRVEFTDADAAVFSERFYRVEVK